MKAEQLTQLIKSVVGAGLFSFFSGVVMCVTVFSSGERLVLDRVAKIVAAAEKVVHRKEMVLQKFDESLKRLSAAEREIEKMYKKALGACRRADMIRALLQESCITLRKEEEVAGYQALKNAQNEDRQQSEEVLIKAEAEMQRLSNVKRVLTKLKIIVVKTDPLLVDRCGNTLSNSLSEVVEKVQVTSMGSSLPLVLAALNDFSFTQESAEKEVMSLINTIQELLEKTPGEGEIGSSLLAMNSYGVLVDSNSSEEVAFLRETVTKIENKVSELLHENAEKDRVNALNKIQESLTAIKAMLAENSVDSQSLLYMRPLAMLLTVVEVRLEEAVTLAYRALLFLTVGRIILEQVLI